MMTSRATQELLVHISWSYLKKTCSYDVGVPKPQGAPHIACDNELEKGYPTISDNDTT